MRNSTVQNKGRSGLIAALDLGSTKLCCFIARPVSEKGMKIVGIGHQVSRGIRSGAIVDMDAAEASIRATVEAAEQMAGENIHRIVVNFSGADMRSRLIAYEISIAGHQIDDADIRRILDPSAIEDGQPENHALIHVIPVGYSLDGRRGVHDPRGLFGERLGVYLHAISVGKGAVRNLESCISRCHLEIVDKVLTPYASALACLAEDETRLGVTCIDMGGGTTSIAVFFDGELVHAGSIPVGGVHVTNDIARGLSTPLAYAERMKTLYGSVTPSPSDDREILKVPLIGEEDPAETSQVPRSMLVGIIRPRLEETFEMVRVHLDAAGFDKAAGRRVVLTGGASQLPGVWELAATILDKQVRQGQPRPIEGLAESVSGPAFATCAGLLNHAVNNKTDDLASAYCAPERASSRLGRFGHWFREHF